MSTPSFVLAHAGKQHAYQVAKALHGHGALRRFYTSGYVNKAWMQRWALRRGSQFWTRRFIDGLPPEKVTAWWGLEVPEFVARRRGKPKDTVERLVFERDTRFDSRLARLLARTTGGATHFWGFQGSCLESLQAARAQGLTTVYEQAAVHYSYSRKILQEEAERVPTWAHTLVNLNFPEPYLQRVLREPLEADVVVCASEFSRQTAVASGVPAERTFTLPLGASLDHIPFVAEPSPGQQPLKLLFAGAVSQLKGIYYLLEAVRQFAPERVQLYMVGRQVDQQLLQPYADHVKVLPYMSQHEFFAQLGQFDALAFPTLCDGFGLVVVEAMASGLPVIATPHSMAPEVVVDGENGYLVPIRSVEPLVVAIDQLLRKSDHERRAMRQAARAAASNYGWDHYAVRLGQFLTRLQGELS